MKKGLKAIGIVVVAAVGFSMAGCATSTEGTHTRFPAVSDYTFIPSKDYVVIGTIVLRGANQDTLIADLMDMAIAMGGHDVINLRVDWRELMGGRREISTATAVVIRFTDETVVDETTVTVVTADGTMHTTTQRRPVRRSEAVVDAPPEDAGGRRGGIGRR